MLFRRDVRADQIEMAKKKRQNPSVEQAPIETAVAEKSFVEKYSKWIIGLAVLLGVGVGLAIKYHKNFLPAEDVKRPVGNVTGCQKIPPFVRALNFGSSAAFSTSDRKIQGLVLVEGERVYQHPTWKMAGSLAPITRDISGDTYVAPAPWIDVLENKPDEQNKIFKVDGKTQQMSQFVNLPKAAEPTSQNPYGALGLAYDCDTSSLYVSSVAGSTRDQVNGRIFQVSIDGKILSQLEKTDAIGLAVFNSAKGKRLFFGQARNSEIWSVALDFNGNFSGEPRKEISLENLGTRGDDKARRIIFSANEMSIFGIEFGFNLIAPSEKQETVYRYIYDSNADSWLYVSPPPQEVPEKPVTNSNSNSQISPPR